MLLCGDYDCVIRVRTLPSGFGATAERMLDHSERMSRHGRVDRVPCDVDESHVGSAGLSNSRRTDVARRAASIVCGIFAGLFPSSRDFSMHRLLVSYTGRASLRAGGQAPAPCAKCTETRSVD
eukprot:scaffold3707_cov228-Pinguiococcus_pyrenoidosus.AAC.2